MSNVNFDQPVALDQITVESLHQDGQDLTALYCNAVCEAIYKLLGKATGHPKEQLEKLDFAVSGGGGTHTARNALEIRAKPEAIVLHYFEFTTPDHLKQEGIDVAFLVRWLNLPRS